MLNPERVDLINNDQEIEVEFTDENADSVITIKMSVKNGARLGHMLLDQCGYAAQLKRKKFI